MEINPHIQQDLFGGKNAEAQNAICAMHLCGEDHAGRKAANPEDARNLAYEFMDEPRASLTVLLYDKLLEMGYKLVKVAP